MEKEADLISVIIPVYNIDKYIEKCINSVVKQTYQNWELILVDDGSTDKSGVICDWYQKKDARIKVIHQKNGGRSRARNAGLNSASGVYVMFVDGDDWIDEDCISEVYAAVRQNQVQMAVFRGRNIYSDHIEDGSTTEQMLFMGSQPLEFYIRGEEGFQTLNAVWGKLYLRELLQDICFVEDKYYEDIMFTTKVYAACRSCIYLNQAYYNYNIATDNSITFLGVNELTFRDEIPIFEEKEKYLKDLGRADLAEQYAFFKYRRLLTYYRDCMNAGEKTSAKRLAKIIQQDKEKIKKILNQPYVSRYYRLYFKLFLMTPGCGYVYEKLMLRVFGGKG